MQQATQAMYAVPFDKNGSLIGIDGSPPWNKVRDFIPCLGTSTYSSLLKAREAELSKHLRAVSGISDLQKHYEDPANSKPSGFVIINDQERKQLIDAADHYVARLAEAKDEKEKQQRLNNYKSVVDAITKNCKKIY